MLRARNHRDSGNSTAQLLDAQPGPKTYNQIQFAPTLTLSHSTLYHTCGYAVSRLDLTLSYCGFNLPAKSKCAYSTFTSRTEAVGLLLILQKMDARYSGHVQLMILTDSLVLLLILSMGTKGFWPDPGDVVHFDVIFSLIQELQGRSEKVILIKVRSHAGCSLNEMVVSCCSNLPLAQHIWLPATHIKGRHFSYFHPRDKAPK